jgi:hypothetical protein
MSLGLTCLFVVTGFVMVVVGLHLLIHGLGWLGDRLKARSEKRSDVRHDSAVRRIAVQLGQNHHADRGSTTATVRCGRGTPDVATTEQAVPTNPSGGTGRSPDRTRAAAGSVLPAGLASPALPGLQRPATVITRPQGTRSGRGRAQRPCDPLVPTGRVSPGRCVPHPSKPADQVFRVSA